MSRVSTSSDFCDILRPRLHARRPLPRPDGRTDGRSRSGMKQAAAFPHVFLIDGGGGGEEEEEGENGNNARGAAGAGARQARDRDWRQ